MVMLIGFLRITINIKESTITQHILELTVTLLRAGFSDDHIWT